MKFSKPEKAYNVKGVRLKNGIYFVIQNYEDFDDIYKMLLSMSLKKLSMATLFEGHPFSQEHLVFNLMKLYVDIEFTGSHTQFYDKFNIRHNIAKLLEYLWQVPSHRNAWIKVAQTHQKGVYLNFLNFLINDSIFLLDESLNKIPELKTLEAEMENSVEWEQQPPQERQERTRLFQQHQNVCFQTLVFHDISGNPFGKQYCVVNLNSN